MRRSGMVDVGYVENIIDYWGFWVGLEMMKIHGCPYLGNIIILNAKCTCT